MAADILGNVKRYLEKRRANGVEVAFRLESASSGAAGGPHRDLPVVTSPAGDPSPGYHGGEARSEGASVPGRRKDERAEAEAAPSIRYSREAQGVEQGSLFGDTAPAERFDLSGYDLASLDRFVSTCRRCALCEGRTRTVFGSGSPASKIVFIGEAPGREEDIQGLPFVGRAGQLLTKMLGAIAFTRDEVYITNILKCRPPNNRDPQEEETTACEPYLARQLELLRPAVICALGRIAAQGLLRKGTSLSFLRKALHSYNDIPVAVTYHPAALLRNPNLKREAWEDLQKIRRLYDERTRGEA